MGNPESDSDISVDLTLSVEHPAEFGILRAFSANIYADGDLAEAIVFAGVPEDAEPDQELLQQLAQPLHIGRVTGHLAFRPYAEHLEDDGDCIDGNAEDLAGVAQNIVEAYRRGRFKVALLVRSIVLEPRARGHRLTGDILTALTELLDVPRKKAVVVLDPLPIREVNQSDDPEDFEHYEEGPELDAAIVKLTAAFRDAGLEPWDEKFSRVWWLAQPDKPPFPRHPPYNRWDRHPDGSFVIKEHLK